MMTSIVFRWMLDPNNGVINVFLHQIGVVQFNIQPGRLAGQPDRAMSWMVAVAVFVSVPFTTYALLAGLHSIPAELYEAARVDGASPARYWSITFPLLRPALMVAPGHQPDERVQLVPDHLDHDARRPGYQTSTSTVYMYNLKPEHRGPGAALSVINFGLVVIIVLIFLRVNGSNSQKEA